MSNIITDYADCQACEDEDLTEELHDKFEPKKRAALVLADSYKRLAADIPAFCTKEQRVRECGTFTRWRRPLFPADMLPKPNPREHSRAGRSGASREQGERGADGWKLFEANFCRDRLCPMCSWRRTYKIFGQVSRIMDCIGSDYEFIFLTLTVPNCSGSDLARVIDDMEYAFNHRLLRNTRFKAAVCGYFKALEITHNTDLYRCKVVKTKNGKKRKIVITDENGIPLSNPNYDTYHPHFHIILAVKKSYFNGKNYIKHDEWLEMWRTATKNPNITQVDVRKVKAKSEIAEGEQGVKSLDSAVAEAAKYSVKDSDFLGKYDASGELVKPFPFEFMDNTVFWLSGALYGRRLCSFGGCFSDVRKKLKLDDIEYGDLVVTSDGSELRADVAYMIRTYSWSCGAYKLTETSIERPAVDVLISADDDVEEFPDV